MAPKGKFKILNDLRVSKPCASEDFASISEPRENGWYCRHCEKEVHDLAKLSKKQILELIEATGGNFCASIRRRDDGSIITKEAPSRSLISSGVFLAGTALLASSASAEPLPAMPGEVTLSPPSKSSDGRNGADAPATASPSPSASDDDAVAGVTTPTAGPRTASSSTASRPSSSPLPTQCPSQIPSPITEEPPELGLIEAVPQHTRGRVKLSR